MKGWIDNVPEGGQNPDDEMALWDDEILRSQR